jgi:hypothetical protein
MPDSEKHLAPQSKCPACGWRLDADAYRCSKCLIYFCFRCRKRIQKNDDKFECVNQECDRHGKLVCDACTESIRVSVPGDIRPWVVFFAAIIVGLIASVWSGIWSLILSAAIMVIGLGFTFDRYTVWPQRKRWTRCCVQCKRPLDATH